jgi:hypothetical protein
MSDIIQDAIDNARATIPPPDQLDQRDALTSIAWSLIAICELLDYQRRSALYSDFH